MDFKQFYLTVSIGLLLFYGCSDTSHIRHYTIQKEAAPKVFKQTNSTSQDLQWTTPSHWLTQPTSSMRIGSFIVPFSDGQADLSIIKLGGDAGGMVANVNRWRGQLDLDQHDESEINKYVLKESSNMGEFIWLTLLNPENEDLDLLFQFSPLQTHQFL